MNAYAQFTPMSHTQAPIENRIANIYAGSESYFTDAEALQVIEIIKSDFRNIWAIRRCPHMGYTRLAGDNVNFSDGKNGIRWVGTPDD